MAAHIVTLSDAGDIRIPEDLLLSLGWRAGLVVRFVLSEGKLIVEPVTSSKDK